MFMWVVGRQEDFRGKISGQNIFRKIPMTGKIALYSLHDMHIKIQDCFADENIEHNTSSCHPQNSNGRSYVCATEYALIRLFYQYGNMVLIYGSNAIGSQTKNTI